MVYLAKSLFHHTMLFSPSQRRASEPRTPPSNFDHPVIDLSSLEGAPIVNPKFIIPPDTTTPRIHTHSRAQYLLSKPLPPRPASTDDLSPIRHYNGLYDWSHHRSTTDGNLRQASARRCTGDLPDELSPDWNPREVLPHRQHISHPPVRPRSCVPLTWLEDEKKWIVGEVYVPRTYDSRHQDDAASFRSLGSPISPISPITPWQDMFLRLDEHINYNNRLSRENLLSQSLPYDRHGFGQTHDTALRDDRVSNWVAATRRMHEDRRNWV